MAITGAVSFDLVVFDLDGTLVDSLPDIAGALNHALAARDAAPLALDAVRGLVGEGVVSLAQRALDLRPAGGTDAVGLAREVVAFYEARPCVASRLYDGIEAMLESLSRQGRRLAVLTNKPGGVARALLAVLACSHRFEAIIGDGDGYARKPDPEAARALLARSSLGPEGMLMVGDGMPDLAFARAAGCAVAAVAWGYTERERLRAGKPDFLLEVPSELLDVV